MVQIDNTKWSKKSIHHYSLAIDDIEAFREAGNAAYPPPNTPAPDAKPIVKNGITVNNSKFFKIKESCQNRKKINLSVRITEGIRTAQRKLFERIAKLGETVVVANADGQPITISTEEALRRLNSTKP